MQRERAFISKPSGSFQQDPGSIPLGNEQSSEGRRWRWGEEGVGGRERERNNTLSFRVDQPAGFNLPYLETGMLCDCEGGLNNCVVLICVVMCCVVVFCSAR